MQEGKGDDNVITVIWHSRALLVPVVLVPVLVLSACAPQPGAPAGDVTPLVEVTEQPSTPTPLVAPTAEATPTEQPPIPSPERVRPAQFAGSWYPDDPDELAGTVLWLLSDAAKYVTGIVVPIDGGFSAFSGV